MSNTFLHKVRELWPGYLNKTLSADDQVFMNNWLHDHGPEHPEFQQELAWLVLTREQLRQATPVPGPEAGWHELLARIDAQPRQHVIQPPPLPTGLLARCMAWLSAPAFAASLVILALVQSLALWMLWPGQQDTVRLMSSSPASSAAQSHITLQITFEEQATVAQVRAALSSVHAQVILGPSALGVWQAQVPAMPSPALKSLIVKLQSQAAVESVAVAQ
jgi:hypothetical protein